MELGRGFRLKPSHGKLNSRGNRLVASAYSGSTDSLNPTLGRVGPRPEPIRIGISSCLLGQEVRFDGGHKRDQFLVDTLGRQVEWVPVCPEVEMGLGTPRETLRLVRAQGRHDSFRMVTTRTGIDHTDGMNRWAARRLDELARDEPDLCGYVLKKDSPSCGMERVKTYGEAGMPERNGRGLFASALLRRFPTLPVEEEGRLNDPRSARTSSSGSSRIGASKTSLRPDGRSARS